MGKEREGGKRPGLSSRDRLLLALEHKEPDRVPFDIGSTQVTGIAVRAYGALRKYLCLPEKPLKLCDVIQQLAFPDEDFIELFGVDVRGLYPRSSHNWGIKHRDAGDRWEYLDEWGILYRFPKEGGLYYSIADSPLSGPNVGPGEIEAHKWPDTGDFSRIETLRELAIQYRSQGKAVMLKGVLAGIFEMAQRIRGMRDCLLDLVSNQSTACALFDKLLELKLSFWEMALPRLGDVVDIVMEADDYGTQTSQFMSLDQFREFMKPRLQILFRRIKTLAPHVKIFFHSCGNVRPFIPEFIELCLLYTSPSPRD